VKIFKVSEHLIYGERVRDLGLFSLENRRLMRDLISVYKYLMVGSKEVEARLFSVVPLTRQEPLGTK